MTVNHTGHQAPTARMSATVDMRERRAGGDIHAMMEGDE